MNLTHVLTRGPAILTIGRKQVARGGLPSCSWLRPREEFGDPDQSSVFDKNSTVGRHSTVSWGGPWYAADVVKTSEEMREFTVAPLR